MENNEVIEWLLQDKNLGVKYRTQTEIMGVAGDKDQVKEWIFGKLPKDWYETKGLWYGYYITALAEVGLSKEDVPYEYIERALYHVENDFSCACSDFMLIRALVMLGYYENEEVRNILTTLDKLALPDGGFLCKRVGKKFDYVPKSCYRANLYALLLLSECVKKEIKPSYGKQLIDYFMKRDIFYKADKSSLIFDGKEGERNIDVFYPFEPMRMGIQNIIEALSALGYGNSDVLDEAWQLLYRKKDVDGKLHLTGTLTKSYLPKEKVGNPSKWATFYMLLAEKERL